MDESRRGFIGKAFGAVAAVGGIASLIAMKKTWDPLPSVMSAGFTTVDVSGLEANKLEVVVWRGKPVFVLKYTEDMKPTDGRSVKTRGSLFLVMGCVPTWMYPGYQPTSTISNAPVTAVNSPMRASTSSDRRRVRSTFLRSNLTA